MYKSRTVRNKKSHHEKDLAVHFQAGLLHMRLPYFHDKFPRELFIQLDGEVILYWVGQAGQ